MIPYCKETGVGLIPWSPLARGVLARPYESRSTLREETDSFLKRTIRSRQSESDAATVSRVEELAKKHGVSMAIIATAWVLSKGASPIIGLSSVARMQEAMESLKFELSDEDIKYVLFCIRFYFFFGDC